MWRRIEVNARVAHPIERVFAYLANPLLWHEFAPAVVYRRQIGKLPPDVGTRDRTLGWTPAGRTQCAPTGVGIKDVQ